MSKKRKAIDISSEMTDAEKLQYIEALKKETKLQKTEDDILSASESDLLWKLESLNLQLAEEKEKNAKQSEELAMCKHQLASFELRQASHDRQQASHERELAFYKHQLAERSKPPPDVTTNASQESCADDGIKDKPPEDPLPIAAEDCASG